MKLFYNALAIAIMLITVTSLNGEFPFFYGVIDKTYEYKNNQYLRMIHYEGQVNFLRRKYSLKEKKINNQKKQYPMIWDINLNKSWNDIQGKQIKEFNPWGITVISFGIIVLLLGVHKLYH